MRADLQTLERIEAYLNGFMTSPEKEQFETELNNSSDLQTILDHQQLIQQAVARKAIMTQIKQFAPATVSSISFWTKFKWPIILSSIVLMALVGYSIMKNTESPKVNNQGKTKNNQQTSNASKFGNLPQDTPCIDEESKTKSPSNNGINSDLDNLKTWIKPDRQFFHINPNISNTLECKNGTLIIVPKNAFKNKEGKLITKNVQLEVVEALNMADMIGYNLTTMNNEKVLQSGGMLYIQPTVKGKEITISKNKPLHIEIPTQKIVSGMMAWKGEVDKKGNINWVDPKEIKRFLVPVNFNTLDFLPEGFANTVDAGLPFKNYKKSTVELVDSLYYSLSQDQNVKAENAVTKISQSSSRLQEQDVDLQNPKNVIVYKDTIKYDLISSSQVNPTQKETTSRANTNNCYIDPLSVKAIKAKPFENTFLATKEFEVRLKALHKISNAQNFFDMYINNLTKNLSDVDQMIANKLSGKNKSIFQAFANEKLTNVENNNIHSDELKAYYNSSRKTYQKEVAEAKAKYKSLNEKELASLQDQLNQMYRNQYNIPIMTVASTPSYKVSWYDVGWINLDCYLPYLKNGQQTVSITTNEKSRGAKVYQCLNLIKTVVPLSLNNGKYMAHFPRKGSEGSDQMVNTYCLGIKEENGKLKYAQKIYNPYSNNGVRLDWVDISEDGLYEKLKQLSPMNDYLLTSLQREKENIKKELQRREEKKENNQINTTLDADFQKDLNKLNAKMKAKQLEIAKENAFIQSLIDKINPCDPNFGESVSCPVVEQNAEEFGI